ncbi:hypothetical protein ACLB2K_010677 [Fragaria x ananassa]
MESVMHSDMMDRVNQVCRPARMQHVKNFELPEDSININNGALVLHLPHQSLCAVDINFGPNQGGIPVLFISPQLHGTLICSRYQDLKYGFSNGWSRFVRRENFQANDMVQLWSFADVNNNLYFAIYPQERSDSS